MVDIDTQKSSDSEGEKGRELAKRFIEAGKTPRNLAIVRRTLQRERMTYGRLTTPKKEIRAEVRRFKRSEKREMAGRKILEELKRRKTFGGRLQTAGEGVVRYMRSPSRELYRRRMTQKDIQLMNQRLRNLKKARSIKASIRQPQQFFIRQQPLQPSPAQQEFNFCFRGGDIMTPMIEREIMNSANGGFVSDGDKIAHSFDNFSNFNNPFLQLERETNLHAGFQHINPILNMNREVNFFSNLVL